MKDIGVMMNFMDMAKFIMTILFLWRAHLTTQTSIFWMTIGSTIREL